MINYKNNFNAILIFLLIPALISGLFLPNLILFILLIYNLIFFRKELIIIFYEEKKVCLLFISFSIILIFSSFLSVNRYHSFESSALYFFFLIYSISLISFLSYRKNRIYFLYFSVFIFLVLSIDAIYELINGQNIFGYSSIEGRIAGLFNDRWLIGRYLVYFLPLFIGIFFIEHKYISKLLRIFIVTSLVFSTFTILFSGERAAFLLFSIYCVLCLFFLFNKIKIYKSLLGILILSIVLIIPFLFQETSQRLFDNFFIYLTSMDLEKNPYYTMWITALNIFKENILFGSGPNNFRFYCMNDLYKLSNLSCSTHPHNIIFQLLSEIGVIGFSYILALFIFLSYSLLKLIFSKKLNIEYFGYYSIMLTPMIQLFPFMISGNFFLSWYGIIYYMSISFLFIYKKDLFKVIN